MADTSGVAPSTGTSGLAPSDDAAATAQLRKLDRQQHAIAEQETELAQTSADQMAAIEKKTEAAVQKELDFKMDPPQLGESPKLEETTQTTPIQAWTSSAMVLAALGSLFTRRPLATAMKSAAAALNAFREGDQERANAAFKKWQVDTENYWKVKDYEMKTYEAIMGQHMDRAKIAADLGKSELDEKVQTAGLFAKAFGDQMMANQRSAEDIVRLLEVSQNHQDKMLFQQQNLEAEQSIHEAMQAFQTEMGYEEKNGTIVHSDTGKPLDKAEALAYATQLGRTRALVNHGLTPGQEANYVKSWASQMARGDLGKNYSAAVRNFQSIQALPDGGGVISQAMALDAWTQLINGGRAIRSFQSKMNIQDAGMYDRVQIFMHKLTAGGGMLSPEMAKDIKTLSREILFERQDEMSQAINDGEATIDAIGMDSSHLDEGVYSITGRLAFPGVTAPPEARERMKEHANDPEYRKAYDQHFGNGASDFLLGALGG
jgi:hypothetical protein